MFSKLPLMLLLSQNIPSRIPIVGLLQNYCTSYIIVLFNPLTRKYFDWLVELKEFGMCATTMCMYWVTLAFSYPALLPFTLFTLSQGASYWQLWIFQGTLSILQRQLILFLGGECCLTLLGRSAKWNFLSFPKRLVQSCLPLAFPSAFRWSRTSNETPQDLITLIVTLLLFPFLLWKWSYLFQSRNSHTRFPIKISSTCSIKWSSPTNVWSSGIFNKGCLSQQQWFSVDKIPIRILLDVLFGVFRFSKASLNALASSFMTF